jgi:hypothetical protein
MYSGQAWAPLGYAPCGRLRVNWVNFSPILFKKEKTAHFDMQSFIKLGGPT